MNLKLKHAFQEIDGLISEYDAETLYEAAKRLPQKAIIVEVGTFKAKSTICMALGLAKNHNNNAKIYSFDILHDPEATQNIKKAGVTKYITLIQSKSPPPKSKWNKNTTIDLLYIDGNHEAPYPENDLKYWLPRLKYGGKLIMDDLRCKGVKQAFEKCVVGDNQYIRAKVNEDLAIATKRIYGEPIKTRMQYTASAGKEATRQIIGWVGGRVKNVFWCMGLWKNNCPYCNKPLKKTGHAPNKTYACYDKYCVFNSTR